MKLRQLLPVLLALAGGIAAHADTFSYTLDGGSSGFSGTGTLTGNAVSPGTYLIDGITGTGVTGIFAPGGYNGNDNLFTPNGSAFFDSNGLGFTDQNSTGVYSVRLYSTNGNYFAFVTDSDNQSGTVPVNFTATAATPEPSSLALLGTGLVGVAGFASRRFRTRA